MVKTIYKIIYQIMYGIWLELFSSLKIRRNIVLDFSSSSLIASLWYFVSYIEGGRYIARHYLDVIIAVLKIIYKVIIGLAKVCYTMQYIAQNLL